MSINNFRDADDSVTSSHSIYTACENFKKMKNEMEKWKNVKWKDKVYRKGVYSVLR